MERFASSLDARNDASFDGPKTVTSSDGRVYDIVPTYHYSTDSGQRELYFEYTLRDYGPSGIADVAKQST